MATRAYLAVKNKKGNYDAVFLHHGHPEDVWEDVQKITSDKMSNIIQKGGLYNLNTHLIDNPNYFPANEDSVSVKNFSSKKDIKNFLKKNHLIEVVYFLNSNNKWEKYTSYFNKKF